MKIHLISDTHLEGGQTARPEVEGDVCVLAGDIGVARKPDQIRQFIEEIKTKFDHVIMVLGNHEFYHSSYDGTLKAMKEVADDTGAHLLDVEYDTDNLILDGVFFWGSTLWTDLKENDWFVRQKVSRGLNDFHVVEGFHIQKYLDLHLKTVERINWDADIIITHHMPIMRKHTKFPIEDITHGFNCTTLERRIETCGVKYWLYGHTHDNVRNVVGNTVVVTNQTGYGRESMKPQYDPKFLIEI